MTNSTPIHSDRDHLDASGPDELAAEHTPDERQSQEPRRFQVSAITTSRWATTDAPRGDDYDERWSRLATRGFDIHGEADLVASFQPRTVLDAGCGTGRVAVELARRGIDVSGVDLDEHMLAAARRKSPDVPWILGDLSRLELSGQDGRPSRFDVVVAAGNVMIYLAPGTEPTVIRQLARHLHVGGRLIAGFQLHAEQFTLEAYDEWCSASGLVLEARSSTWDGAPLEVDSGYAVSVHRHT